MSAADSGEPSPQDKFLGFRTYADDTPRMADARAPEPPSEMAAYPADDDLSVEAPEVYQGEWFNDEPRDRRSNWPLAAGVTALVLILGGGAAWMRRGADGPPRPAEAPPPVTAAANSKPVATASLAPRGSPVPAAPGARRREDADPIGDTLAKVLRDLPAEPDQAVAAAPPAASASDRASVAAAQAPAPSIRPSFDCRYARSYAQQMICDDPDLAAQDRRMTRAYAGALAAGVPQDELRAEQGDWLDLREDAARRSPQAMRSLYQQRIEELEALAADGPG